MYQKLIHLLLIFFLITSCSKEEPELNIPASTDQSFVIYNKDNVALTLVEQAYFLRDIKEVITFCPKANQQQYISYSSMHIRVCICRIV